MNEASWTSIVAHTLLREDFRQQFVAIVDRTMPKGAAAAPGAGLPAAELERRLLLPEKLHIKVKFEDGGSAPGDGGAPPCKFYCQVYYPVQFAALRAVTLNATGTDGSVAPGGAEAGAGRAAAAAAAAQGLPQEMPPYLREVLLDEGFIRSLSHAHAWEAKGGKSGAAFSRTLDGRFVIKHISRTELNMFLDFALNYFDYLGRVIFHGLPSVLCRILGVFQVGYQSKHGGKHQEHVVVMQDLWFGREIECIYDLKGSVRNRYANLQIEDGEVKTRVLLDENLIEVNAGMPIPLEASDKSFLTNAIMYDTWFLSLLNIVDYSIIVGVDKEHRTLVVGIIDYMRQYDIIKKMERLGKSVPMIAGQAAPTVIQPPAYRQRFRKQVERYFSSTPNKFTSEADLYLVPSL